MNYLNKYIYVRDYIINDITEVVEIYYYYNVCGIYF